VTAALLLLAIALGAGRMKSSMALKRA